MLPFAAVMPASVQVVPCLSPAEPGPSCQFARAQSARRATRWLRWSFSIQGSRRLILLASGEDAEEQDPDVKPLSKDPWFFRDPDEDPSAQRPPLRFLRERKPGSHPRERRRRRSPERDDSRPPRNWGNNADGGAEPGGGAGGRTWTRDRGHYRGIGAPPRAPRPPPPAYRSPSPPAPTGAHGGPRRAYPPAGDAAAREAYYEDRGRSSREALVNEKIKQAGLRMDLWGIEELVREHRPHLNSINISTAVYHIGKIVAARRATLQQARPALLLLEGRFIETADEFRPRALSNVIYGCALSRYHSAALLAAASRLPSELEGNCSNLLWSLATLKERDAAVFEAVAARCLQAIPSFNEQNLSNVAWACAALGHYDAALFDAVAKASLDRVSHFTPQGLATLAWSFATLRAPAGAPLLEAAAAHAVTRLSDFAAQGLSLLCWSFATFGANCDAETPLGPSPAQTPSASSPSPSPSPEPSSSSSSFAAAASTAPGTAGGSSSSSSNGVAPSAFASPAVVAFFTLVAGELVARRLSDFSPQAISNIVWAFAKVGVRDEAMLSSVAAEAARRLSDFGEQNISNVAWGFAKLQFAPPRLFGRISEEARRRVGQLTGQGLANVAWAFATVKFLDAPLFRTLAENALTRLDALNCQQLANLAWAFGTMRVDNLDLMRALADEARQRGAAMKAQELTMLALAFAYVRFDDPAAIDHLVEEARKRLAEFSPQEVSNLAWAFIAFGRHDEIVELGMLQRLLSYQRTLLLSPENLNQLGIILFAFRTERPELLPSFPDSLREAVTAYYADLVDGGGYDSSGLHISVAGELAEVRGGFVEEHFAGAYFLDIAYPDERVCVEVDGPLHYLALSGRLDGDSELKDRLLARDGWTVHHVTYREWNALPRHRRRPFLAALLEGRREAFLAAEPAPPPRPGPGPGQGAPLGLGTS
eukprot:tig00000385_g24743.t1